MLPEPAPQKVLARRAQSGTPRLPPLGGWMHGNFRKMRGTIAEQVAPEFV